jgi:hypothetical protein
LFSHVQVGFSVEDIAFVIFELLFDVGPELGVLAFSGQFFMQCNRITNCCDVSEMDSVGDLETSHPISVSPFLEVHFKCPPSPIRVVTTYLTFVLNAQSMQLEKPVRNRFAIPPQRQILGIVNWGLTFLLGLLFLLNIVHFLITSGLFLPHQVHCIVDHICQFFS